MLFVLGKFVTWVHSGKWCNHQDSAHFHRYEDQKTVFFLLFFTWSQLWVNHLNVWSWTVWAHCLKTKTGHQFLLILKCAATRFPEAGPFRRISAPLVINTLTKFCTTFWSSGIKHIAANAYHPQYQGALEQWHQTLGSKLQKYCLNTSKYLDEEVPMVVFAIQESLFGHSLGA